jgi:beta-glucanase (GH16 family)
MDIGLILSIRFAGSEWSLNGEEYAGLTWLSDTPKPTEKQLSDLWPSVQYEVAYAQVERARAEAYRETSDPIFFEYQRGDKTEAEWLAAVQAVKTANPYPPAV